MEHTELEADSGNALNEATSIPVTHDGSSLKQVMLDTLKQQCQAIIAAACKKADLPASDPDHYDAHYLDALNENVLKMGAKLKTIINNASTIEVLCDELRTFNHETILEDEDDQVAFADESTVYAIYTAMLEAGLHHLDPQGKRMNVLPPSAGQQLVSLKGRDINVSRARKLEAVLQEYGDGFDAMTQRVSEHADALTDIDANAINEVIFARKGFATQDEIKACILAAAKAQFAVCRDHVVGSEELRDSRKNMYLRANQKIFEALNMHMTNDDNPPVSNLMGLVDHAIESDFWDEERDSSHLFYQAWAGDLLHVIEKKLQQNDISLDNAQGPVTSLHAARVRKQESSDEVGVDESIEAWLTHIMALKHYTAAGPQVMQACDSIISEGYGYSKSMLAVEAQARMEEIEIKELDDAGFDKLCERAQGALQEYLRDHFFDRVNAMKLRDEEGLIELDFDYDDDDNECTYPLQTYMLVRKAYDLAKDLTPSGLEGTAFYGKALKRCEDHLLADLAKSDSWQCDFTDDYLAANRTLQVAAEQMKRQRG